MKLEKSQFFTEARKGFEAHPAVDKILVTGDGNLFLLNALSLAKNHCQKYGLQLFEITRDEAMKPKQSMEVKSVPEPEPVPEPKPGTVPDPKSEPEKLEAPVPQMREKAKSKKKPAAGKSKK